MNKYFFLITYLLTTGIGYSTPQVEVGKCYSRAPSHQIKVLFILENEIVYKNWWEDIKWDSTIRVRDYLDSTKAWPNMVRCKKNYDKVSLLEMHVVEYYRDFPTSIGVNVTTVDKSELPDVLDPRTRKVRKAHGLCTLGEDNRPTILLNEEWFTTTNEWYRRKVVYHEFGHCAWNLEHPRKRLEQTLMNQDLTTINQDGSNWNDLLMEFRQRAKKRR